VKPTLIALALMLCVAHARADTKSVLDARGMALNRSSNSSVTSGIGTGAKGAKRTRTPSPDSGNPRNDLTR
jgi:hypothetical protein